MKMKLIALALTIAFTGSNVLTLQAETNSHIHIFSIRKHVNTTQDGTYTHKYIVGVNPITGTITYGNCDVTCETEYYTYMCSVAGCFATEKTVYSEAVETHNSCGK